MAEQKEQTLKCAVLVGMREDGSVFVETYGTEQNLITLDGLLDYGKRYVDNEWAVRKPQPAAPAPVEEPAEEVEAEILPLAKPKRKPTPRKKKQEVIEDVEVSE